VDFLTTPDAQAQRIHHPLSGARLQLPLVLEMDQHVQQCEEVIATLTQHCPDDRARLLSLWRFLPTRMAALAPALALLPAHAQVPDHTIWNALDFRVALTAARSDGRGGALLSFTLGPVQSFIMQARSLRDLWAGSYLLSWLTFAAMQPVLDAYGPTALVFPSLRGNSLYDLMLRECYDFAPFDALNPRPNPQTPDVLLTGSLPNTFLALVPVSAADDLARHVEQACRQSWQEIGEAVLNVLESKWEDRAQWAIGWADQVEHFWDIHSMVLPLQPASGTSLADHFTTLLGRTCWPPSQAVDTLARLLQTAGGTTQAPDTAPAGTWALYTTLAGRVLAAIKHVRHIPRHARPDDRRAKCTLMGALEQMGPSDNVQEQHRFWDRVERTSLEGTHLRANERLCAVALVKRFCWAAFFAKRLKRGPMDLRFSDTATIATADWLQAAGIDPEAIRRMYRDWSGEWLFQDPQAWQRNDQNLKDQELDRPPPPEVQTMLLQARQEAATAGREPPRAYYAAMVMDGDHMGKWLSGEKAPRLRDVYHPKLMTAFEQLASADGTETRTALDGRRPLTPVLHAAITAALGNFARDCVPGIVETTYRGELVYAGGDDVLALLPTRQALQCLSDLRDAYSGRGGTLHDTEIPKGWEVQGGRLLTLMGHTATASAGLAIAHYKADLRAALEAARNAEHTAKQAGRNALGIAVLRRSGEHSQVVCPWDFVPTLNRLVQAFVQGASDRWTYHLHVDIETLAHLGSEAVAAEITRVVNRGDLSSRRTLVCQMSTNGLTDPAQAGVTVADCYRAFLHILMERARDSHHNEIEVQEQAGKNFVALAQAASFLARGRDDER
jgi:CRISPR-associated protein Cmr2